MAAAQFSDMRGFSLGLYTDNGDNLPASVLGPDDFNQHRFSMEVKMTDPTDKAKDAIDTASGKAEGVIHSAADRATQATHRAKERAHHAVDDSRDALEGAISCAKEMVRANPLATVAIVAALAYLCGRMKS